MTIDELNIYLLRIFSSFATLFTLLRQFVPQSIQAYIIKKFNEWTEKQSFCKNTFTLVVDEYSSSIDAHRNNIVYNACEVYLSDKLRSNCTRLKVFKVNPDENTEYYITKGDTFVETLENKGIEVQWKFSCKNDKGEESTEGYKVFELNFDLEYKDDILDGYIPLVVMKYYEQVMAMKKEIYLYTVQGYHWNPVKFKHPFTFDSLALDPDLKKLIIDDLERFIRRKEFYKRVGKAWKRGYLLYGPPGTGKSSLVAAMANYLRFSIYDLQLGGICDDATLRRLMLGTQNKSILVIEDIDCTIGLSLSRVTPKAVPTLPRLRGYDHNYYNYDHNYDYNEDYDYDYNEDYDYNYIDQTVPPEFHHMEWEDKGNNVGNSDGKSKISLSGLLNIIDGLWSSCGDERIIIFTTNHKEKLDPAMLRPGRMDMHIHMSYLTMKGFKVLANNYLGVSGEHPLFDVIEPLLETTEVTPAQVAEELIRTEDVELALYGIADLLKKISKQSLKDKKGEKEKDGSIKTKKSFLIDEN